MEIDRQMLKALASESRLAILKSLAERRKMPAELQRQLGLAGSTIIEHLDVLEKSGLVKRIETGHKWIYYELTEKGFGLVRPKFPVQFVLVMSLGVVISLASFVRYLMSVQYAQLMIAPRAAAEAAPVSAVPIAAPIDWVFVILLLSGLGLVIIGIIGLLRGRYLWLKSR